MIDYDKKETVIIDWVGEPKVAEVLRHRYGGSLEVEFKDNTTMMHRTVSKDKIFGSMADYYRMKLKKLDDEIFKLREERSRVKVKLDCENKKKG